MDPRTRGRTAYVPGISPPHREMDSDGLTSVGIRSDDCGMIGITLLSETNTIKKRVRFVSRDPDGKFEPVTSDESLFEDEEGRPLS